MTEVSASEVDVVETRIPETEGAQQALFLVREQTLDPNHLVFLRRSRWGHLPELSCESHRSVEARIVPAADDVPGTVLAAVGPMPPLPDQRQARWMSAVVRWVATTMVGTEDFSKAFLFASQLLPTDSSDPNFRPVDIKAMRAARSHIRRPMQLGQKPRQHGSPYDAWGR